MMKKTSKRRGRKSQNGVLSKEGLPQPIAGTSSESPVTKRPCHESTPENFKLPYPAISTPKSCAKVSKSLFCDMESNCDELRAVITVRNVPHPFMRLTFTKALEKFRMNNGIERHLTTTVIDCFNYSRKHKTVQVKFTSQEVADKVLALKSGRFLNNETLSFETIPTSHVEISAIVVEKNEEMVEKLLSAQNLPVLNSETPSFEKLPSEDNGATAITQETESWLGESLGIDGIWNEKDLNEQEEAALNAQFNTSLNLKDKCSTKNTAVNFSGLSSPFDKPLFEAFLKKCLVKKNVIPDGVPPNFHVCDYLLESKSVVVDFGDPEIAEKVVRSLKGFEFLLEECCLSLVPPVASSKYTAVNFSGISSPFSKTLFEAFLKKCLVKKNVIPDGVSPNFQVSEYQHESESVVVEFGDANIADEVVRSLQGIEYLLEECSLSLVPAVVVAIKYTAVNFSGISSPFSKPLFEAFLKKCLVKKNVIPDGVSPNFQVSEYQHESESVVVEFGEANIAEQVVRSLQGIEYLLEECCLSLVSSPDLKSSDSSTLKAVHESEEEDDCNIRSSDSCHVLIFRVPTTLRKDAFTTYLNFKMVEAKFSNPGPCYDCITSCSDVDNETESVVVEFSTCEQANLATLLENVVYEQDSMSFKLHIIKYIPGAGKSKVIEDKVQQAEVPEMISLDSSEGTAIFMKLLIKHKESFPRSGSFDLILEKFRIILIRKNTFTNVAALRVKRVNLRDRYHKAKKDGRTDKPLFTACSVAFGNEHISRVRGTDFDPGNDPDLEFDLDDEVHLSGASSANSSLTKFCKVASWTTNAAKVLIGICIDNQEEFDKPIRHPRFWAEVSQQLSEHRYYFKPAQCENKVNSLKAVYKDLIGDAGTGADGLILKIPDENFRGLMTLVHQLIGDSVVVNPKITANVGLMSVYRQSEKVALKNTSKTLKKKHDERKGRKRGTVLKRKLSVGERRVAALEKRARALEQIANTYTKKMQASKEAEDSTEDSDEEKAGGSVGSDSSSFLTDDVNDA